jgi:hypothetical protein
LELSQTFPGAPASSFQFIMCYLAYISIMYVSNTVIYLFYNTEIYGGQDISVKMCVNVKLVVNFQQKHNFIRITIKYYFLCFIMFWDQDLMAE